MLFFMLKMGIKADLRMLEVIRTYCWTEYFIVCFMRGYCRISLQKEVIVVYLVNDKPSQDVIRESYEQVMRILKGGILCPTTTSK